MPNVPMVRGRRSLLIAIGLFFAASVVFLFSGTSYGKDVINTVSDKVASTINKPTEPPKPTPKYKPTPTYTPPPVKDPFPLLATSTPPPIPKWNQPKKNIHKEYGLSYAPPLMIGFTRSWPILLQAVVSYITAGWPASQIYVVENTGVQQSNKLGKLTLQNPFYLNHEALKKLGVNIIQTPVLLNFAQLQNFYVSLAHDNEWPYYFWSHMDVLVLSFEDGLEGHTPRYTEPGYKTVYELSLAALNESIKTDSRWANRFFAYDHLALVQRDAYDAVGGWDTMIPYYITDCDMHSRLGMAKWTQREAKSGIITDVATALDNLLALYRDPTVTPSFTDPNPPPPPPPEDKGKKESRSVRSQQGRRPRAGPIRREEPVKSDDPLEYWRSLVKISDQMFHYKHGDRGRNTWQRGQRGGIGEPYYYPAEGLAQAMDIITEAGREVFRNKWGHRECDLISGAGLKLDDQWKVEKDWQD